MSIFLTVVLILMFAFVGARLVGWLKSVSPPDYTEYSPTVLIVDSRGTLEDLDHRQREWRHGHTELDVQKVLIDVPNQRIIVYLNKPIVHKQRPTRKP